MLEKSPFHKYFFFKNLREDWGRCNAGRIFRVNDAGPGYDRIRGYYVGFDARKLYLGKIEYNWQPLAEFDLVKLDCKVLPDVWNQIRVAAESSRIRVWLNRMRPSADSDRGLRIDFTGAYAGGSEIMHLAAHKGKLYAANGNILKSITFTRNGRGN